MLPLRNTELKDICPICLRNDRKLKVIPDKLSEYHDELTKYTLSLENRSYCSECECLLRKTYNFHQKCSKSAEILENFMYTSTMNKTPVNMLHLKLPPITLGIWMSKNHKEFNIICADITRKPVIIENCVPVKQDKDPLMKLNISENLNSNETKNELINIINQPENVFEVKFEQEPQNVLDDETEYPDDTSLNSDDDCNDYLHSPLKKRKKKVTLDEEANTDISDEDLCDDSDGNEDISIDNFISKERHIISKLESMDKELDSISKNWEVTSLFIDTSSVSEQRKEEIKKLIHTFITQRKTLRPGSDVKLKKAQDELARVGQINTDLNSIVTKCVNAVEEYKFGMSGSKERLKAMLKSWGELKSDDGIVFDKNIIIERLEVINERMTARLIKLMRGKTRLNLDAVKVLKYIQNKKLSTQYESVFDVQYLTTEKDKLEEFEKRKTYECYVKAKYKCDICYQWFKTDTFLECHRKQHDESQGQYACRICHVRYKLIKTMYCHTLSHNVVYKCRLCPMVIYNRKSMLCHYYKHEGTNICKCEKCGNTYKSKQILWRHQKSAHPSSELMCTICGGVFLSQGGLKLHMMKKHPGESSMPADGTNFTCEECTLTFSSKEDWLGHRRTSHAVPKVDHRKSEYTKKKLKRKSFTVVCPECKAVGYGYGWVVKHFSIEHPTLDVRMVYADKRIHLCDTCGKGFTTKYALRDHIDLHIGVRYPCPTCNKQFGSQFLLKQHQLWHGPPGYCCDQCGKKFHSSPSLSNHMRTHIGDRCFKCHICGKGFLHRASLREHIRGVHYNERRVRKRGVADTRGVTDTSN